MSIADEVEDLQDRGLAGMKFKVGGRSPEEDAARFGEARAAAGPDFMLAADANQGWTREDAVRFARLVEDSTCTGSRSRAAGRTTAAPCETCG